MLSGGGIIKSEMVKRGYKHRRTDEQFSMSGEYARNLQLVYSNNQPTKAGLVVDLVYFAVDIRNEKLVVGLYRENPSMENGVYINSSRLIDLKKFNADQLKRTLDDLILPVRDKLK